MADALTDRELVELVRRVFRPRARDERLLILSDLPTEDADTPAWRERRALAAGWARQLESCREELGLTTELVWYPAVGSPNADLPARGWRHPGGPAPESSQELAGAPEVDLDEVLAARPLVLAPTEYSATAPLKVEAGRLGFRAATMPGFTAAMLPSLRLDWEEVERRLRRLAVFLDEAEAAEITFEAGGAGHHLTLDLRHRTAHVSGGLVTEPGSTGNLPSGESYVVPYEGEVDGDPSRSAGSLPVRLENGLVVYRIRENRAVAVTGEEPAASTEGDLLAREPAYGNLAELGLGILAGFGVVPVGETLLDEKLGLHLAFGRSDHLGGQVGVADFSDPREVVHIDRVYLAETQPRVQVPAVDLRTGGGITPLMRDGRYVVDFT